MFKLFFRALNSLLNISDSMDKSLLSHSFVSSIAVEFVLSTISLKAVAHKVKTKVAYTWIKFNDFNG